MPKAPELNEPVAEPSLDELWKATPPLSDDALRFAIAKERDAMNKYITKQNERLK